MIEIILIISLSVIFIILLRHLPEVKLNTELSHTAVARPTFAVALTSSVVGDDKIINLWKKADEEFDIKNYKQAEKLYLKIASKDPKNPKVYGKLGIIYLELGNYLDAKDAFSEAVKRDSGNAFWYNNLGLAFYNLKRFNESIDAYKKSVAIDSDKAIRYFNLGLAYEAIGEQNNALVAYEKSVSLEPTNQEFRKLLNRLKEEMEK
jgi:tetratricopeptide (TPR) repeat protein